MKVRINANSSQFVLGLALLNAEPTDSKDESVKLSFQVLEGGKGGGGIDMADLRRQLAQAHGFVKQMRADGAQLSSNHDQAQVVRIADHAEGVLEGILADPGDIRRARRFMATYLERATQSVSQFVLAEAKGTASAHRTDFNATLDVIEQAFDEQKQRLDAEDTIDLEVQLDVLRKQMEREGL